MIIDTSVWPTTIPIVFRRAHVCAKPYLAASWHTESLSEVLVVFPPWVITGPAMRLRVHTFFRPAIAVLCTTTAANTTASTPPHALPVNRAGDVTANRRNVQRKVDHNVYKTHTNNSPHVNYSQK